MPILSGAVRTTDLISRGRGSPISIEKVLDHGRFLCTKGRDMAIEGPWKLVRLQCSFIFA